MRRRAPPPARRRAASGSLRSQQREQLPPRQLLRAREQRARSRVDALVVHVHRPRDQLDPALVGHPDHGGVDAEQRHDRLGEHVEGRRRARGSARTSARSRTERVEPLRLLALRRERRLAVAARASARARAAVRSAPARRAARRARRAARSRSRSAAAAAADRRRARRSARRRRRAAARARSRCPTRRPARARARAARPSAASSTSTIAPPCRERSAAASSASAIASCGPSMPRLAATTVSPVLAEIDGDAVGAEQLGDALDRRVERVRERQPRDRLADDRQQRAAPLELEAGLAGALRRAERVRRADGEARELRAAVIVGRAPRSESEAGARRAAAGRAAR